MSLIGNTLVDALVRIDNEDVGELIDPGADASG